MDTFQLLILAGGVFVTLVIAILAFSGPSAGAAQKKRLEALKTRHTSGSANAIEQQMKRIVATRLQTPSEGLFQRFIPNPALLSARLDRTGKSIALARYVQACIALALVVAALLAIKGVPVIIALLLGIVVGLGLPHFVIGILIGKRGANFTSRFPDAIDLMVRGLRSGLPISETLSIVASEIPGACGVEFRNISDRIRIGKTMDQALQETADRLNTPEIQFFAITLQIQRETGGNLAETLSNLSEVLRKRSTMKLKIKAMSSESKASAFIIGALPFCVFAGLYSINPEYMGGFFEDVRLMIAMGGGLVWMSIGAAVMAKMISFEI